MSAAVYPIFAGGLFDTIVRAMQTVRAEEWPAEVVEEGISLCQQARRLIRGSRHEIERLLRHGCEAKMFVTLVEPPELLWQSFFTFSRVVEELGNRDVSPLTGNFLSEAQALSREAADLHRFLSAALAKANIPPRPIDWQRVKDAEEAYSRGETKPFQKAAKAEVRE